jgi:hypothetical protein
VVLPHDEHLTVVVEHDCGALIQERIVRQADRIAPVAAVVERHENLGRRPRAPRGRLRPGDGHATTRSEREPRPPVVRDRNAETRRRELGNPRGSARGATTAERPIVGKLGRESGHEGASAELESRATRSVREIRREGEVDAA